VRGAFTGADRDKPGMVEHAGGGTLFLDEIGDMPLATQAKMLRVLQNQEVLRVGSLTPQKIDVRVIAATHRDLREAIAARQFREDLYYRLSMVEIHAPRLAEHLEDLPLLTRHFVTKFNRQYGKQIRGLTQRAQIVLGRHSWPGNVRELENVIGHACMMALGEMIDVADFPDWLQHPSASGSTGAGTPAQGSGSARAPAREPTGSAGAGNPADGSSVKGPAASFEDHEKNLLVETLARTQGNQAEAARQLHIGRDALRYKMKKHGLL
jgi:DNA-binding NtrC family response regulator